VMDGLPDDRPDRLGRGIDACLGVTGVPRSGSGHVTIMTGVNAAARIGRHEGPYPGAELRRLLHEGRSLPSRLRAAGRRVAFANAFSPTFHDRLARGKARWSGFGLACALAGLEIRGLAHLLAGEAISAWPSNQIWADLGYPVPLIHPRQAGERLARLALRQDVTFYEYFATDAAGHRGDRPAMEAALRDLDHLIAGAWPVLEAAGGSLLIASDHGNVEDVTRRGHTLNPALFVAAGPVTGPVRGVRSLSEIAPAILEVGGDPV